MFNNHLDKKNYNVKYIYNISIFSLITGFCHPSSKSTISIPNVL